MTRARRHEPPAPAARKAAKAFAPGDRVLIVGGMSKGITAVVVAPWPDYAPGIPAWRLNLPDARDRVIRGDFLERVEVDG